MTASIQISHVNGHNFNSEVIESSIPVIVEFGATWCGPCHILAPVIDELAKELAGRIKFCKLDIDNNHPLKNKFGIHDLPTFIVFNKGIAADYIIGTHPKSELRKRINKLLSSFNIVKDI
jgi:thioredoxin 1